MAERKKQPKDDQGVPPEIDTHFQMYGKMPGRSSTVSGARPATRG